MHKHDHFKRFLADCSSFCVINQRYHLLDPFFINYSCDCVITCSTAENSAGVIISVTKISVRCIK